jgi:hypothetical protein
MMNASDISIMGTGKIRDRVWGNQANKLRGCCFLSRNRLKRLLRGWRPSSTGKIGIVVVEYENMEPTWMTTEMFQIPDRKDDFIVELANLSDLHGIIRISGHEVWVRRVRDPRELNIDAKTVDRIANKLGLEGFGK